MDHHVPKAFSSASGTRAIRASMESSISRMIHRLQDWGEGEPADQAPATFEVPLFMARSRGTGNPVSADTDSYYLRRSRASTHSVIEAAPGVDDHFRPLTLRASSVYSKYQPDKADTEDYHVFPQPCHLVQDSGVEEPSDPHLRQRRRRKRVSRATLRKIQVKARLSIVFGITLLISLVLYVALAVTGVGQGTMFHVLSLMLILCLTGLFCHASLRLMMLMRSKGIRVQHRYKWWRWKDGNKATRLNIHSDIRSSLSASTFDKPFPIIMVADEEAALEAQNLFGSVKILRPPPPVYGNVRESIKIDPDLVHYAPVPTIASPTTPTYEEAMRDAQAAVRCQPPVCPSRGEQGNCVRQSNVHPLERERLVGLMRNRGW